MSAERIRVCDRDEVGPERVATAAAGRDEQGIPVWILVLELSDGSLRAYRNLCRHLPVPLDGGSGQFLSPLGELVCGTHGATYRPDDGYCVAGPCVGTSLQSLVVEEERGAVFVRWPPAE